MADDSSNVLTTFKAHQRQTSSWQDGRTHRRTYRTSPPPPWTRSFFHLPPFQCLSDSRMDCLFIIRFSADLFVLDCPLWKHKHKEGCGGGWVGTRDKTKKASVAFNDSLINKGKERQKRENRSDSKKKGRQRRGRKGDTLPLSPVASLNCFSFSHTYLHRQTQPFI